MKKLLSLILLFSLTLGLLACGTEPQVETTVPTSTAATTTPTETTEDPNGILPQVKDMLSNVDSFSVGFCRLTMKPEESIPLDGYGNNAQRYCTDITEDICTTAVAIADESGNMTILINADLICAFE